MEETHTILLIANFAAWLLPVLYWKGNLRLYILLINSIFSASYWTYIAACDLLNIEYGVTIIKNYVDESLIYSAIAGLSFNTSLFIFSPQKIKSGYGFETFIKKITRKIPGNFLLIPSKLIFIIILVYCYSEAISNINIGDRKYYISLKEIWYIHGLPILAILSAAILFWEYQKNKGRVTIFTLIAIYFFALLVGFDGGRRPILITVFALAAITIMTYFEHKERFKYLLINLLTLITLSGILSFGRNLNVGWQAIPAILNSTINWQNLINYITLTLLSPMPTVHVNTLMLEYTNINGTQGYSNYVNAILNTMFPNFIFNQYLFGEPLVARIEKELGWFGFDFGFMAESIYSGGLLGVIITHAIIGIITGIIIKSAKNGSPLGTAMMAILIFGMINSLRSDFMNLLKSFLYPSAFTYIILNLSRLKLFKANE